MSDDPSILRRLYSGLKSVVTFEQYADAARQACDGMPAIKLPKADALVNYRQNATADDPAAPSCFGCRFYQWGACSLVEGTIEASDSCDLWREPVEAYPDMPAAMDMAEVAGKGGAWRLFIESAFAEPPARVPLLPKPGTYEHPSYGKLALSSDRIASFVANLNAGIYQKQLPVDAEHQLKLSGAIGWISSAEVNADGSADALVEWTDRGRSLIEADAYKYVSPEWYETWADPATGAKHSDVLIGLALTTRPFFKDGSLRPLVASEGRIDVPGDPGEEQPRMSAEQNQAAAASPQEFTELKQSFSDLSAKFAESEQRRTAAEERVAKLETEQRRKAFTDEVMGRSDANNVRWFGDVAKHVAILEELSETGRQAYIEQQRETAQRVQASIGSEIGSDASGVSSAKAEFEAKAKAFAEKSGGTIEAARAHVTQSEPALVRRMREG